MAIDSKLDRAVRQVNGQAKPTDEPNNSNITSKSHEAHVPFVAASDAPTIIIESEKDMKKHETRVMKLMAALTSNPKKLPKAARKIGNLELEDGAILAMVGSSSFLHGIDC